jgi:hypothetical protein
LYCNTRRPVLFSLASSTPPNTLAHNTDHILNLNRRLKLPLPNHLFSHVRELHHPIAEIFDKLWKSKLKVKRNKEKPKNTKKLNKYVKKKSPPFLAKHLRSNNTKA